MIFETHAHYDDESFDGDREKLLDSLPQQGIGKVINVCAGMNSLETVREMMERYPCVYGAVGIHPDEVEGLNDERIKEIRALCRHDKTVAVGEIGLDYYWDKARHEVQIQWFEYQMQLAREEKLPVIIHSR